MSVPTRPPNGTVKRPPYVAPMGRSGLRQSGGFITEEYLPELQGERFKRTIREMTDNDPVIGAIIFLVKMMVRQVQWRIDPKNEDDEADVAAAQFVEEARTDMEVSWPDTLAEIVSFLPWGWAVLEILYKQRVGPEEDDVTRRSQYTDNKVGWRSWALRGQETLLRWEIDEETEQVTAMFQAAPPDYRERRVELLRCLHFRSETTKGNPEGRTILRNAYGAWYFKTQIQKIEAIGIERDYVGYPVMGVPPELLDPGAPSDLQAVREACQAMLQNMRRDDKEGILYPLQYDETGHPLYELKLLSTGGTRQFNTSEVINRYDQRMLMTVLSDVILMGHEQVGSFALADSKTELFAAAIGAWLDVVSSPINEQAIPGLLRLNGMDGECVLEHGDIEVPDLTVLSQFVSTLKAAGIDLSADPRVENHLRQLAGFPVRDPDEEPEDPAAIQAEITRLQQKLGALAPPGMIQAGVAAHLAARGLDQEGQPLQTPADTVEQAAPGNQVPGRQRPKPRQPVPS